MMKLNDESHQYEYPDITVKTFNRRFLDSNDVNHKTKRKRSKVLVYGPVGPRARTVLFTNEKKKRYVNN